MKTILVTILIVLSLSSAAQKQGNTWYFGIKAGANFSSGPPVAIFDGKTGTDFPPFSNNQEGTASISDSAGHLLFYTGGATIWNKNHIPMPNGTGIMGGPSSTQSAFIVPKPGSRRLFYVFTTEEFQHAQPQRGYRYSVVDMCLNEKTGDVLSDQKNILLIDSSTEKLATCEDLPGTGYWVMGHKLFTDEFYAWHLTSAGITSTVISHAGMIHGWDAVHSLWNYGAAQGQMKFNPTGTKLALAFGNIDPATIELFDFDKNTGVVSNACHIEMDAALQKRAYGIEFSPDGTKVYAGVNGGSGGGFLYQFNLNAGDCNSIASSAIKIFDSGGGPVIGGVIGMQLAPDNKIYCVTSLSYKLGCIHAPNLSGVAADFDSAAVAVSPGLNSYTLPSFIAGYKYHNNLISCDTSTTPPVTPPVTPPIVLPVIDSTCRMDIETRIYTNPSTHTFIVDKKPTTCRVTLSIYNMIGQCMLKNKFISDGHNEIQLTGFAEGVYFYEFFAEGRILLSGRILKQ